MGVSLEGVDSGSTGSTDPQMSFPSTEIIIAVIAGLMITSLLFEFLTNSLFKFLKRRNISKRLLLSAYKELMILGFISFFAFLSQNVFFSSSIPANFLNFVELVHFELAITGLLYMITIVLMLFSNIYYGKIFSQYETSLAVSPASSLLILPEGNWFARRWKTFDLSEYYHVRKLFIRQYKLLKEEFDFSDFLKSGMNNVIIQILPLDWKVWFLILTDVIIIVVSDVFIKNEISGNVLASTIYVASTWIVFVLACITARKCKSILRTIVTESRQTRILKQKSLNSSQNFTAVSPSASQNLVSRTEPWYDSSELPGDNSLQDYSSSYSSFASLRIGSVPTESDPNSIQMESKDSTDDNDMYMYSTSPTSRPSHKISRLRSRDSSLDEIDTKELLGKKRESSRDEETSPSFLVSANGTYHSFPVADEDVDFTFTQRSQEEFSFFRKIWRWFGCYQLYLETTYQEQLFWLSNASMMLKIIQVLVLSQVVCLAVLFRMAKTWWALSPIIVLCSIVAPPATLFIFLRYLLPLYSLTGYSLPTVPSRSLMKRYVKKHRTGPFSFGSTTSSSPPASIVTNT